MERHSESVASRGPRAPSLCLETVSELSLSCVIKYIFVTQNRSYI